jgi:hypothetical protein
LWSRDTSEWTLAIPSGTARAANATPARAKGTTGIGLMVRLRESLTMSAEPLELRT